MTVLVLCLDSLDPVGGLSPVKEDAAAASERPTEPQSEPKDKENVDAKEVDKEKNTEAKGAKKEPDKQAADANAEGGKADGKADGEQASKDLAGEIQKPEAGMEKKEGEEEKENVKVEPDDMSLTEQQGGEAPAAAAGAEQSAAQPAAAGGAGADTAGEMEGVESWWSSQSEPQESSSEQQAADPAPASASGGVHARGAEGADAAPVAKRPRVSDDASTEPQAAGTAGGAAEAEPKPAS